MSEPTPRKETINATHEKLGVPSMRDDIGLNNESLLLRTLSRAIVLIVLGLIVFLGLRLLGQNSATGAFELILRTLQEPTFWAAVGVGLLAQAIDGALGMAYGVTASTFLLATGAAPAMASAATHVAEVFTTGVSGVAHQRLGNVNKRLFLSLLIPGLVGGLLGAYVLSSVDAKLLKPIVSAYLLVMGLYVLSKGFRKKEIVTTDLSVRKVSSVAVVGGFMDTTGGGGWGPIVTTSLVGAGSDPKVTIGSVNYAEFFLTLVVSAVLFSIVDSTVWVLVSGLVVGGLFAAPFAAYATRYLNVKTLLVLVGGLITAISLLNLYRSM